MGWAQHNLTAETRDRIARTLFVVQQEDGDWLNGLCPFHDDRTMSFGYNVTDDVFKCFASCTDSGDLVDLWCRVKGYPVRSADGLRAFKREYAQEGLAPAPRKTPGQLRTRLDVKLPGEIPENVFSVMEPVSDAMMGELSRRRGWTRETLDELVRFRTSGARRICMKPSRSGNATAWPSRSATKRGCSATSASTTRWASRKARPPRS